MQNRNLAKSIVVARHTTRGNENQQPFRGICSKHEKTHKATPSPSLSPLDSPLAFPFSSGFGDSGSPFRAGPVSGDVLTKTSRAPGLDPGASTAGAAIDRVSPISMAPRYGTPLGVDIPDRRWCSEQLWGKLQRSGGDPQLRPIEPQSSNPARDGGRTSSPRRRCGRWR